MEQQRRFMQGGPGHSYQNGPRQQDGPDNIYGQYGPPRRQGRSNGPGNFRSGDRAHSHRMDSRAQQNGSMEGKEETLTENRIFPLERPSPMFPNAKWFCRLCHQHFNQMVTALEHCTMRIHARKKAALDLRKVVLAMPRAPEASHEEALKKELMNVYHAQKMTEKNLELRENVLNEVSTYLQENLKKSDLKVDPKHLEFNLHLQGSSLSKLGLSSSDINMDLHLCQGGAADVQAKIYFEILRILEDWSALTEFDAQLNLTIPMVKALHKPSNFSIDISFGGVAPVKTNRLLQDYASLDERLAPLAVNFRYWAKQCSLDDPQKGFLPAHSFAIMTVFYLQQVSPPVLPCIHDSIKDTEDDDYKRPEEQKDWKSENKSSIAELWLGMLRFYAAEFPVKKLCVSIRSRKKSFLAQRRWPPRFIGIEDPYCKKKSLAKCIVSDLVMPYLLMCLRASYIYFAVPRSSEKQPLFDFPDQLKLDDVEDPEGDDIEDGLAADDEVAENEDDQDQDEDPDAALAADGPEVEVIVDLRGWNQSWPENIQVQIRECNTLQYSMESVGALTGKSTPPVVCILCRQPGHRSNSCPDAKLPEVVPVESHVFLDAQGTHSELCKYIYENFRPTISEQELSARVKIVQEIEAFIQRTMPEAYLTLFGSSRNGFSLEKADLDICLKYKNKEGIDESMDVKDIIMGISKILEDHPDISEVQAIASAKVPIVKFHHDPFGVDGDISLYNVLAEHNTAMLKAYSLIDERVVLLGAAFKQYVKLCDMGDASKGSLSSYAYIVMLIHYLQKENVVPVLQALPPIGHPPEEELPKVMIDGWNAYYFNDIDRLKEVWPLLGSNKKTVGQLWLGLIDYYATKFRFDHHVVCIRQLEPMSRLEKMWTNKPLCVEDPFELDHNLGTGISAKMARYIFSALITSRNWFLRTPERSLWDSGAIYKHFMNIRELAVGKPPKDRGCKRCGKIGHWIKACPVKQGEMSEKKSNRRVCHSCGKPGHIVKDCPTRLKQIRTPKDRPNQQHHQQQQQHLNSSQHPMQQPDNRFPTKLFPSSTQAHSTIAQNDMTNSIGNSFVTTRDGTSGMAQENKTVSEELGTGRKNKNKKSSKKKLAQTQRSEMACAAPSESLAADAPSVRHKIKNAELSRGEGRQREQKREESQRVEAKEESSSPPQPRRKTRREKRAQNRANASQNQYQNMEENFVESVSKSEEKCSKNRRAELPHLERSVREEPPPTQPAGEAVQVAFECDRTMTPGVVRAKMVSPQKEGEVIKPFRFEFDIPDPLKDKKPSSKSGRVEDGVLAVKPKNQKKSKKKTKKTQASEGSRENTQAAAQKTSQTSTGIAMPLSVDSRHPGDLESRASEPFGPKVPKGSPEECLASSRDGDAGKLVSQAGGSTPSKKQSNPSRSRQMSTDDDRGVLLTKNSDEKTPERADGSHSGAIPACEKPLATEVDLEAPQTTEKPRKGLLYRKKSPTRDTHDPSTCDPEISEGQPKMTPRQLRNARRQQMFRASRDSAGFQPTQFARVRGNDQALEKPEHAEGSSSTIDRSNQNTGQDAVRSKRTTGMKKNSTDAPTTSQSPAKRINSDIGDVCENASSEGEPVVESMTKVARNDLTSQTECTESQKVAQTEVESPRNGQTESSAEEAPKAEKSRKAAKRAQNKALRNAKKKLERAAALSDLRNGNRDSAVPAPSAASAETVASSTSPEELERSSPRRESRDGLMVEQPMAAEGDSSVRKKSRSSKKKN